MMKRRAGKSTALEGASADQFKSRAEDVWIASVVDSRAFFTGDVPAADLRPQDSYMTSISIESLLYLRLVKLWRNPQVPPRPPGNLLRPGPRLGRKTLPSG